VLGIVQALTYHRLCGENGVGDADGEVVEMLRLPVQGSCHHDVPILRINTEHPVRISIYQKANTISLSCDIFFPKIYTLRQNDKTPTNINLQIVYMEARKMNSGEEETARTAASSA
jgi:hypothetical protein